MNLVLIGRKGTYISAHNEDVCAKVGGLVWMTIVELDNGTIKWFAAVRHDVYETPG